MIAGNLVRAAMEVSLAAVPGLFLGSRRLGCSYGLYTIRSPSSLSVRWCWLPGGWHRLCATAWRDAHILRQGGEEHWYQLS